MPRPILNALKNNEKIKQFIPYLLDTALRVEKTFPGAQAIPTTGYNMAAFKQDNQLVMSWFAKMQTSFKDWRNDQLITGKAPLLAATGSRSFNASYTESDLECAIVSENFSDFLDFCRFLHSKYETGHQFIAIKTLAGLPLLIIKGANGFNCPELEKMYPSKSLPQLEVTFRHPGVHNIIQRAGEEFFSELKEDELESYVFNKRYIELLARTAPKEAMVEGKTLKSVLEEFKGALAAALKCLPAGILQETPAFNKDVFAEAVKPKTILANAVSSGMTFATSSNEKPAEVNEISKPQPSL